MPHPRHREGLRSLATDSVGETTISDEPRGGLEGRRHMTTKDKGGKGRKKAPAKTLKQKRQTKKAKQAGGTAK